MLPSYELDNFALDVCFEQASAGAHTLSIVKSPCGLSKFSLFHNKSKHLRM